MGHTKEDLQRLLSLPLEEKIQVSTARIIEWYENWGGRVYVAFSGGKDSTVLLDLVRRIYPDVPAVFCNTGLEFPELQQFVKEKDNITILRPKMMFTDVIKTYGYPLISKEVSEAIYYARRLGGRDSTQTHATWKTPTRKRSELEGKRLVGEQIYSPVELGGADPITQEQNSSLHNLRRMSLMGTYPTGDIFSNGTKSQFNKEKWLPLCQLPIPISHYCCNVMKKMPSKSYGHQEGRFVYLGVMTSESRIRKQAWIRHGCNAFESSSPISMPLAFWTEQDIFEYISTHNLNIASVYGNIVNNDGKWETTGYDRTGW